MRIIGGRLNRRQIRPPAGLPVRPTTDKAKEALFNILNNHIDFEAVRVLDLFSGTGSIAYEFASRNAIEVIAVDNNLRCTRFIKEVKGKYALDNLTVLNADALRFLRNVSTQFDIIFCDPPYEMKGIEEIPGLVFDGNLLLPNGFLILEHTDSVRVDNHPAFVFKRNYSKVHFSFFEAAGNAS